ncbi:hypothetical protein GY45DRAFT_1341307 [Cubamyces sp. BRFM 1775]|nr:hypothetical protein GY45DRAFT_1341307 [Cubamyces sp. BRFM 1775]
MSAYPLKNVVDRYVERTSSAALVPHPASGFIFCTASPSGLCAGFTSFIASLGELLHSSPTLSFHMDDPDALTPYTVLLEAISPAGAVSLRLPNLQSLGPLRSILGRWEKVICLHLSLDATDGSLSSFGDRFIVPLQSDVNSPLPVMVGVELLILTIPDLTVGMNDIGMLLENIFSTFPSLHTVHIHQNVVPQVPDAVAFTPRWWFKGIFKFLQNPYLSFDYLVWGRWIFDGEQRRFHGAEDLNFVAHYCTHHVDVVIVEESRFRRMGPVIIQDMLLPADVCKLLGGDSGEVRGEVGLAIGQIRARVEVDLQDRD